MGRSRPLLISGDFWRPRVGTPTASSRIQCKRRWNHAHSAYAIGYGSAHALIAVPRRELVRGARVTPDRRVLRPLPRVGRDRVREPRNSRRCGIDLEIRPFTRHDIFQRIGKPDEPFDLSFWGWIGEKPDPSEFLDAVFPFPEHGVPRSHAAGAADARRSRLTGAGASDPGRASALRHRSRGARACGTRPHSVASTTRPSAHVGHAPRLSSRRVVAVRAPRRGDRVATGCPLRPRRCCSCRGSASSTES